MFIIHPQTRNVNVIFHHLRNFVYVIQCFYSPYGEIAHIGGVWVYFVETVLDLIEKKKISKNKLLSDLGLSKNSFVNWTERGTTPNGETIVKIADYLDVSADYLLGRTPNQGISVKSTNNSGVIGQVNAPVTISNGHTRELTAQERDLIRIYNAADGKRQNKIMNFVYEVEEELNSSDQ